MTSTSIIQFRLDTADAHSAPPTRRERGGAAGDVILSPLVHRLGEDVLRAPVLYQAAGASDAETLLLAAGERQAVLLQIVFDLVLECRAPQGPFDQRTEIALVAVDARSKGDVVVDGLLERIRLLEHHAHSAAVTLDPLAFVRPTAILSPFLVIMLLTLGVTLIAERLRTR